MTVTIHVGDCIEVLRTLPAESVHCVVTSPPYYGLRDYGEEGQLGLEDTPDEYIARLVAVFREARRVLRADGVAWLNLGDSYARAGGWSDNSGLDGLARGESGRAMSNIPANGSASQKLSTGYKPKDLMMMPARVALALQADGWWLRSQVIWHKPNCMPESVTDRPTTDYECVYLLAKEARYFYDADAVREEHTYKDPRTQKGLARISYNGKGGDESRNDLDADWKGQHPAGRNKRTVWTIPTRPFSEAHFATFPPDLVEPMIRAGTSERGACPECGAPWERVVETVGYDKQRWAPGEDQYHTQAKGKHGSTSAFTTGSVAVKETTGWRATCDHDADPVPTVVLDPFAGAGTTGLVADRLERDAILIELNPSYADMTARRIYDDAGMFADVEVIDELA